MSGKLKEVKTRIASVKSTQQITKAMKLVAASKLRKATEAIVQMRPYESKLTEILKNISSASESGSNEFGKERPINRALVVVITSDKGLAGSFNANIVKKAKIAIEERYNKLTNTGNLDVMFMGKKGYDALKNNAEINHIQDHQNIFKTLEFGHVSKVVEGILEKYANGEYDRVDVAYSKFRNAAVQFFQLDQYLPIAKNEIEEGESEQKIDYIFEPQGAALVNELVPKILKTQFYRFLLDTNASEHGARMTAMDSATENANDLLKELKISYNKERQAAITTELTEIVSGAAALDNG